jgi:hypothetical protein
MKKASVSISYIVLTLIAISILVFSTACAGGGGGGGPVATDEPTPTASPSSSPSASSTPSATAPPTPTGRTTPGPKPTPLPLSPMQGPIEATASDAPGTWFSSVYKWAVNDHYYMIVLNNTNVTNHDTIDWNQAKKAAAEKVLASNGKQGHLVTITSPEEQRMLMSTFDHCTGRAVNNPSAPLQSVLEILPDTDDQRTNPLLGLAIGAQKIDGTWAWVTGETFEISKGYWIADYFPDNYAGVENYLHIYTAFYPDNAKTSRYGWDDYKGDPTQTFGYIVEFE